MSLGIRYILLEVLRNLFKDMKTEGSKKLGGELLVYSTDNTKQAARDAKLPNQLHCPHRQCLALELLSSDLQLDALFQLSRTN